MSDLYDEPEDSPADAKLIETFLATEEMGDWQGFVEAANAAIAKGEERAELPLAFLKTVIDEISTGPTMFAAVREVWNRACDEQDMPSRKFAADDDTEEGGDGPF